MSVFSQIAAKHYGVLPEGWRLEKSKFLSNVQISSVDKVSADDEEPVRLCNYVDVYYNDRITPDLPFMEATATAKEIENFTLRRGQVLMTKDSEGWDDIGISALVSEDMLGVLCGYHLAIVSPDPEKLDGGFLAWVCRADALNDQFKLSANGVTRFGLGLYAMKNAVIGVPALETQRSIAAFLDEKTAKIDALIAKKQSLLERLAEKRQAVVTQAVTRGLDPTVPVKNSGIGWLGEVPTHWEVVALNKVTSKITNGYVGPTRDIFVEDGIRYIQSLHIKNNRILFGEDFFVEEGWSRQHAKSILAVGDVLIVQTGDIGQVAYVPAEFEGCNCHALIICTPIASRLSGRFLAWLLSSDYGQDFLQLVKTGALHPHLNCGNVKFFNVLLPPLHEQNRIADLIDAKLELFEDAVGKIQLSIEQLCAHRSALISAAVTGQRLKETFSLQS
jgi:type I restriction enzyme, S subunit